MTPYQTVLSVHGTIALMALLSIPTAPLHGYQVLFSPYSPHRLAFTGAQNYGITGKGSLVLYEEIEGRGFVEVRRYPWRDGLFDVTWSELSEDVLVVGGGDASVLVFDQKVSCDPVAVLSGHTAEVSSVQWSVTRQEQLVLSSSWDGSVRVWDPQSRSCVSVFTHHQGIVYSASWAPHLPRTLASVSGDEQICLWDLSQPNPTTTCHAHSGELLSCDWSKYDSNVLFTGGVDTAVRMWDIRNLTSPVLIMGGHTQAVRRIKCDPFRGNIVLSCSYDFTVRVWDVGRPATPLLETIGHHTEFTFGLDLSALEQGKIVPGIAVSRYTLLLVLLLLIRWPSSIDPDVSMALRACVGGIKLPEKNKQGLNSVFCRHS